MKNKVKIPKSLRPRLRNVAKEHGFDSLESVASHFVTRGLKAYSARQEAPAATLEEQMDSVVEEIGYSSRDELIEHLLLRGLAAYEQGERDPAKLEARLRGLGYID